MITLYDNPYSPFARKVRMVLHYKGISFQSMDALAHDQLKTLGEVNSRKEVPVLVDSEMSIVDSADITAYLDDRYPEPPLLPGDPELRAKVRKWVRKADTVLDAIIHDITLWWWPTHQRNDSPPQGLFEAGLRDIDVILNQLEKDFTGQGFLCGIPTIADFALFSQISSLKPIGIQIDKQAFPLLYEWRLAMHTLPAVKKDLDYIKQSVVKHFQAGPSPYESDKIIWRGDRIEWLFHNGFHHWWISELEAGRVVIPAMT